MFCPAWDGFGRSLVGLCATNTRHPEIAMTATRSARPILIVCLPIAIKNLEFGIKECAVTTVITNS